MAITTSSTTGNNTSATKQAALKVQIGGCITEALKAALESQLIIEFPDALSSGSIDVLTSTAVNQIVSQLVVSDEFKGILAGTIATDEYITQVVTAVIASSTFTAAVNAAVLAGITDTANITTIAGLLCNDTAFRSCVIGIVTASTELITIVDARISTVINALDLCEVAEDEYDVVAGNVVNVSILPQANNGYYFAFQPTGFTASGGGVNAQSGTIQTRTPSGVTINFPNALPGDVVKLYWMRLTCA